MRAVAKRKGENKVSNLPYGLERKGKTDVPGGYDLGGVPEREI